MLPVSWPVVMQAEQREKRMQELQKARAQAECDMASERQKLEEAALPLMLDAMWAANVMDIQQTLRVVCQDVRTPLFAGVYCLDLVPDS